MQTIVYVDAFKMADQALVNWRPPCPVRQLAEIL
jgi:hypothetical protein